MVSTELTVEEADVRALRPYKGNSRTHSKKQVRQIADSIKRFGFTNPVLIGDDLEIIAGHGRVAAAKLLGLKFVPVLRISHLNAADRRAYILADNKLALNAGWDLDMLAIELQGLADRDFDLELTGFSMAEIDLVLDDAHSRKPDAQIDRDDILPNANPAVITRSGDIWHLGKHRLICGDARDIDTCRALMDGEKADLIFTDPPYNVKIGGNVCGSGRIQHEEFSFASGKCPR